MKTSVLYLANLQTWTWMTPFKEKYQGRSLVILAVREKEETKCQYEEELVANILPDSHLYLSW
jgi:hypothetical protein